MELGEELLHIKETGKEPCSGNGNHRTNFSRLKKQEESKGGEESHNTWGKRKSLSVPWNSITVKDGFSRLKKNWERSKSRMKNSKKSIAVKKKSISRKMMSQSSQTKLRKRLSRQRKLRNNFSNLRKLKKRISKLKTFRKSLSSLWKAVDEASLKTKEGEDELPKTNKVVEKSLEVGEEPLKSQKLMIFSSLMEERKSFPILGKLKERFSKLRKFRKSFSSL